jgi:hypothetical protein
MSRSRTPFPWLTLGDIRLVDVTHVLNHLVSPHKSVLAAPMAAKILAVHRWCTCSRVYSDDVSLQVSFSSERLANGSARFVETEELRATRTCQCFQLIRARSRCLTHPWTVSRRLKAVSRLSVAEPCLSLLRWTSLDRKGSCTGVVDNVVEIVDWTWVASGTCRDTYSPGGRATASSLACLSVNFNVLSH